MANMESAREKIFIRVALPRAARFSGVSRFVDPQGFPTRDRERPTNDSVLNSIRCNSRTDLYYRNSNELRVCDFLALHHSLDPDALHLHGPDPYQFVLHLKEELRDDPCNEFRFFLEDFDFFCLAVISRELRCISINRRDPLQSVTTAQFFLDFIRAHDVTPAYLGVTEKSEGGWLYFPHITPALKVLQKIAMLWETSKLDGQYRPGDMSTAPDLKNIDKRFGSPKRQTDVMTTIVRPISAHKGRRPKPRSTS
jgi:hypothetical protein